MGFLDRLGQLVKGKASELASDLEDAHPDAVYEAAIEAQQERCSDIRRQLFNLDGGDPLAADTRASLDECRRQIEALKREKAQMLAKNAVADAQIQAAELASGVGAEADARGISSVRDHVAALERQAPPPAPALSPRERAQAELAAMKRARGLAPQAPEDGAAADAAPAAEDEPPKKTL